MGLKGGEQNQNQNFPSSNFFFNNFPDEAREAVSCDKPKKRMFAYHDIAKECVFNVLVL